jgi:hypothetical protein
MAGVSVAAIVEYPKTLTDADWQKKKGLIGKTKKTGLGDELVKAHAMHKKIDGTNLLPQNPNTEEELQAGVKAGKDYYAKVIEPFRKQLLEVDKVASKAAETLKKVTGGGDASKAALAVAKAATDFALTCKSIDLDGPLKEMRDRIAKKNMLAAKFLMDSIKKFLIGAKVFLADGSTTSWNENIKQQGRSVSNSVKQLDNYNKEFWSEFQKFQGFDLNTLKLSEDSEKDKAERIKLVKKALLQVTDIAKFKG